MGTLGVKFLGYLPIGKNCMSFEIFSNTASYWARIFQNSTPLTVLSDFSQKFRTNILVKVNQSDMKSLNIHTLNKYLNFL